MVDPKDASAAQIEAWTKITTLILGKAMIEMGQKLIASAVDPGLGIVKEEGRVCNQEGCDEPAVYKYLWPTDAAEKYACRPHGEHAKHVGETLGFPVTLNPIGGE